MAGLVEVETLQGRPNARNFAIIPCSITLICDPALQTPCFWIIGKRPTGVIVCFLTH